MKKYLLGVDIGGTTIKIGQFDLDGELLQKWDIPTRLENQGEHILMDVATFLLEKVNLSLVRGIGFGVPGPVNKNTVFHCVNLGWKMKDVAAEFSEMIPEKDIILRVSNDANVAAAGELYQGIAKGYKNMVMFTLGTGVGGGIIVDGKVIDGINGVAGEVGHMFVDPKYLLSCNCGKKGCLETVSSATGIVALAKIHLKETDTPSILRRYSSFSAKKVFDAAKEGDKIAFSVVDEAADYLAYAFSLITHILNPEIYVLGGGVSNAGEFLIERIEDHYYDYVKPFISHSQFAIASLGNDAGIYGAAYLVR